jgi:hypothetical protein
VCCLGLDLLLTFVHQAQTDSRRVPSAIVPAVWFCMVVSSAMTLLLFRAFVSASHPLWAGEERDDDD